MTGDYSSPAALATPTDTSSTSYGSGGGSGSGGGATDYAALIAADPIFQQAQQFYNASLISDASQRNSAAQRALIAFGLVPSADQLGTGFDWLSQALNPQTQTLAQQNTQNGLSIEARLGQAHDQATMALRNSLAARGALSSGDANYRLNLNEQGYAQSQQDALNKLLDSLSGYQSSYLGAQQSAEEALLNAMAAAYGNILNSWGGGGGGGGGGGSSTPPSSGDQGGGAFTSTAPTYGNVPGDAYGPITSVHNAQGIGGRI